MKNTLLNVTINTTDALGLARWWAAAFDGEIVAENDGWFVIVSLGEGRTGLAFQRVDDPAQGNRIHFDFGVADRAEAVTRLVDAGAVLVAERSMPEFSWTVLADPEGNEFCVATHH
ncbi:hypothetical protein nbrc107696_35410 [Gordonia spumicola]|uniref:VOC domain-containing protein n=1 Tax=Gordonia spumicola TaxID=589161 RepID=A0A7I9VCL4_9ACTN|nr:VOC family protein [Gordonia spumicola]GEE03095.1 hypothetical protein nbrc107696_35410 [Gordonia spumicola]